MTVTELQAQIPGYVAGTWVIDPVHSEIGFSVRHLMLSKVRGRFAKFEGRIDTPEQHPVMTYRSTGVRAVDNGFLVDGNLSLHGVTRPVTLALQLEGILASSPFGDTRAGFSATAEINRSDFDINFGIADTGGVGLGDKVQIALEVEAVLQTGA